MYTVLLADDEQAVLDTLTASVQWQLLGIDRILTAADGIQALEQLQKEKVDLLITDIRMPRMDGLTLLRQVRSLYPAIRCILLTAYGEFEYAREALQLGVENYLLKPFQQAELEQTIEKALDNLYINKVNDTQLFRHNILVRWMNGDIDITELSERVQFLDINVYQNEYCVIVFRKTGTASLNAFGSRLKEQAPEETDLYDFWDNRGQYIMIAGGASLSAPALGRLVEEACGALEMQGAFLAAIGAVAAGCEDVAHSYQTALELLETADADGRKQVLISQPPQEHFQDSLSQGLEVLFHIEDSELRLEGYRQFARKLSARTADLPSLLAAMAHSLYHLFENQFPGRVEIHSQLQNRLRLSRASASGSLEETVIELLEYSYLLFQYYFEQLSPVIQLAVGYIHTNYAASLSIKEFCNKNKMNTAYFGFLFKKETGMFFNNYLTQYRVCCSLRLLETTQMQIGEISEAVGFTSANYYVSCFKKQTGLSPARYRSLQL